MKNTLTLLLVLLLGTAATSCKKEGCTDDTANNFDAEAKKDNGTCTYDPVLEAPTVKTTEVYFITDSSATGRGDILSTGGTDILTRGICWSTSPNPTVDDNVINGGVSLSFDLYMGGLVENSVYYVKAFASNSVGLTYGNEISFTTTDIVLPTVTTDVPIFNNVTQITVGGNISNTGNGLISERGVCWGTSSNPTVNDNIIIEGGTSSGLFSTYISNLQSETTYYIRAYAKNQAGISYGQEEVYVNPHVSFVGEFYQGGIVYYLNNTGEHGLICALDDQSLSAQWGCQVITGANGYNLFEGEINTNTIVNNSCYIMGIAADLCANYSFGGYTDWILPSGKELQPLSQQLNTVNSALTTNGGTTIGLNTYWSSTEIDANNAYVWQFANDGSVTEDKSVNHYVRAIRAF